MALKGCSLAKESPVMILCTRIGEPGSMGDNRRRTIAAWSNEGGVAARTRPHRTAVTADDPVWGNRWELDLRLDPRNPSQRGSYKITPLHGRYSVWRRVLIVQSTAQARVFSKRALRARHTMLRLADRRSCSQRPSWDLTQDVHSGPLFEFACGRGAYRSSITLRPPRGHLRRRCAADRECVRHRDLRLLASGATDVESRSNTNPLLLPTTT